MPAEFFTGINYWRSESAINMWENFNPASIENDLRLLRDAGITHLRVFPLWPIFQPLTALYGPDDVYEYSFGESAFVRSDSSQMAGALCKVFLRKL